MKILVNTDQLMVYSTHTSSSHSPLLLILPHQPQSAPMITISFLGTSPFFTANPSLQNFTPSLGSFLRFFTPQVPDSTHSVPKESPVKSFAWHNYQQMFAIALQNDTIYIYDLGIENWIPITLKHEFQHHISTIEWSPQSGTVLAVSIIFSQVEK